MNPSRPLAGIKVLVIEDDRDTAELFTDGLELLGADARYVQNATEAIAFLQAHRVDVLVCDVALPGVDGHELLARIRALPELATIPAITVTGFAAREDRERSIAAGFQKHLVKPISLADVAAAIASVTAPHRDHQRRTI
jgi:CheY-like chemotaxis protein